MAEASTKTTARKSTGTRAKKKPDNPVAARVAELRTKAGTDPGGAREEAWAWIEDLGQRARENRKDAHEELQQLFLTGEPADDIKGQTEGILVTWTLHPLADRVLGTITGSWMPWLGKAFTPETETGVNTLTKSARLPSKLLWPLYSMRDSPLGHSAFDFKTYVEAGKLDPSVDVLVIDYESVPENPALLIRAIRDELVRIVPGANLGKMLVKVPRRKDLFPACYFALKSELGEG
jgi:hypothetical protein